MRTTRAALAVILAGVLVAGCGADGDGGPDKSGAGRGEGAHGSLAKLTVPAAYDSGRGWDQVLDWVPEDAAADPVATDGETVAYLVRSGDGYAVQARDGATGEVRWTGAPYRTPPMAPDAPGAVEIPGVGIVRQGGRTYVVVWATGERTGDALGKSEDVVQVGIYPADASGGSVAPLHRVSVTVDTQESAVEVRDSGAGLLIMWRDAGHHSAALDMESGKVTRYDGAAALIPGCESTTCLDSRAVAVTVKGPVINGAQGGMGVPDGWRGEDVAPEGVEAGRTFVSGEQNGTLTGVHDGRFVARWRQAGDSGASVRSAHDLADGRLLASTACEEDGQEPELPPAASPNGAYLAQGTVLFDVKAGKGLCLAGDETRRSVRIGAVSDSGTAYGVTYPESSARSVVELDASTGSPKVLPEGTLLPAATLDGAALFTQRENGTGLRLSVRLEK
ncbi:hypothetical protein [Streptomyces prasinus]